MVLTTLMRDLVKRRQKWLADKKMTIRDFSDSVDLDYNTMFRVINEPRRPHRLYAERILRTHPDFPIR